MNVALCEMAKAGENDEFVGNKLQSDKNVCVYQKYLKNNVVRWFIILGYFENNYVFFCTQ